MKQALIIIDVQNDYFPNGRYELKNTDAVLQKTVKLQHYFRTLAFPIFYIQHIKSDPHADFFTKGTVGADIHADLLPMAKSHEYIVQKAFPNSFYQTELQSKLQQENIKQLVICGMMTHMCVDSTVRYAAELNYQPILIHDACTTRDLSFDDKVIPANAVHNGFMSALMNFATVMSCHDFINNN